MKKLEPWIAVLLAPIVGFLICLAIFITIKYMIWVIIFIGCTLIGVAVLSPFVNTDEEEKS